MNLFRVCVIIFIIIAQSQCLLVVGQNAPEGIVITTQSTTATQKPTTKRAKEKTTTAEKLTTKVITTTLVKTDLSTEAYSTQPPTTRLPSGTISKTKKKSKAGDNLRKEKTKLKEIKKKLKENKEKSKEAKKKLRENKKKEKAIKKKIKETRRKTKILLSQSKSRLKELKRSVKREFRLTDKAYMKSFLQNCTLLLRSIKKEKKRKTALNFGFYSKDENVTMEEPPNGFDVVQTMNTFGNELAVKLENERARKRKRRQVQPISAEGIEMEVSAVSTKEFKGYKFPDPNSGFVAADSIALPSSFFSNTKEDNAAIVSIVYDAFYAMTVESNRSQERSPFVNSRVVSTEVNPKPTKPLAEPVEIILRHLMNPNASKPECVFWKVNESYPETGRWSSYGCYVHTSNQTHTVCHCNHLTNFAVLFRVSDTKKISVEHEQALTIVSLVGCLLSSICLMITVVVFIVLRKLLRSTRNLVHFNLAVALLVANILIMLSGKAVANRNMCISVSLCLYYFFLSAFFWMLGEGIYIWIMVAKAFSENLKAWMYLCIGWGIPFIIVAVAFAVLRYDLIATEFCWLSIKKGAIWSFAGPVIFVIAINFGILVKVLSTAIEHQSSDGKLKVSARLTLLLLPILGLTWIFGLFAMNEDTVVFEYLFTFFNSCQGIFILVCYIAFNAEVKNEYQKWKAKKEYSQSLQMKTTSSSGGTSVRRGTQNETSEMIS